MPALTPNSPASRFEHVLKTYWGKSYANEPLAGVVYDTFYVTISLIGAHDAYTTLRMADHVVGSLRTRFRPSDELDIERIQNALDIDEPALGTYTAQKLKTAKDAIAMLARLGQPYVYTEQGEISWGADQWALAELVIQVVKLPQHSPSDFLIPWVARELAKLAKAAHDEEVIHTVVAAAYSEAVDVLYDKSPAIAQWAKESRTDIGKVNLTQALEAIATYKFKQSLVEQGTVVYKYKDGWTVQELRTPSGLEQEGKNMQNCVGGYCDAVIVGLTRIYSIRDTSGNPHVTMELSTRMEPSDAGAELSSEKFVKSEKSREWFFAQILGKQNDAPTEEYKERAREFIDKVFAREGFGWCIAGGSVKLGRFNNRQLTKLDVPALLAPNHVEADILSGADFSDSDLSGSTFGRDVSLRRTIFNRAQVSDVDFGRCDLEGAQFEGATCHFTNFLYAFLVSASFDSALLQGAGFSHADVNGATFRDARVDGAVLGFMKNAFTANWEGVKLTESQHKTLFGTSAGYQSERA